MTNLFDNARELKMKNHRLFGKLVHANDVKSDWVVIKRYRQNSDPTSLRQLLSLIEGKFSWTQDRICFERKHDALIFYLMFPANN